MFFNWRGTAVVLGAIALVVALCAIDLSCSSGPAENSAISRVKGEMNAAKSEHRTSQADEFSKMARDMRVMAKRFAKRGDTRSAQRAINAALELDRKAEALRKKGVSK